MQKILPEAVTTSPDGYLRLTADAIYRTMLNSIKELKTEKDAELHRLREELAALKERLDRLEAK